MEQVNACEVDGAGECKTGAKRVRFGAKYLAGDAWVIDRARVIGGRDQA